MRSRYSGFVVGDAGWLSVSWHPSTRPRRLHLRTERWTRLDIVAVEAGGLLDQQGTVEFVRFSSVRPAESAGLTLENVV
jgi:SEC-C motif-containing protein